MSTIVEKFKTDAVLTLSTGVLISITREPGKVLEDVQRLAERIIGRKIFPHDLAKPEIYKISSAFICSQYKGVPSFGHYDNADAAERVASMSLLLNAMPEELEFSFEPGMREAELTLSEMIAKAIELKDGNKEFALFYMDHDKTFFAEIGNPASHAVMLGESSGEVGFEAMTADDALKGLLEVIPRWNAGERNGRDGELRIFMERANAQT